MKSAIFAVLFLFFTQGAAFAEGFAIYAHGARGAALGGAMMAREPDASAIASNPALLTRLPGQKALLGLTVIATSGYVDWRANGRQGRSTTKQLYSFVPHAYYTRQISDDWFLGIGQFSRFGLGITYPPDWPGRFSMHDGSTLTASLNPVVAWKASGKLSLAAGAELLYATLDLKKRTGVAVAPGVSFEVDSNVKKADDVGLGFNLAAHYQFNDKWAAGLQYRSQVRVAAKGDIEFAYIGPDIPALKEAFNRNFINGGVKTTVTLPDSLAAGIAYSPTPDLSFEAGAIWTRWSTYGSLDLDLPGNMPLSRSPTNWRNSWRVNAGVEYEALDWLTLRAGYSWENSPMTSLFADYTIPTDGRQSFSLGLGFHNEAWSFDIAYTHLQCRTRDYLDSPAQAGGKGTLPSTGKVFADEFAFSVGYNF